MKEILKELLNIPSPSGYEKEIAEFIYGYLSTYIPSKDIDIDKFNNVIVNMDNGADKTVMVDAHLDEISFMVNNVDNYGSISVHYIGSGDATILSCRNLNILTKNGIVNAVVNRKHSHLVADENDENIYYVEDADIDIGVRDRNKVLDKIRIGDAVVYESNFRELSEDFVSGYGFDDKSGCAIMIDTIIKLYKAKIKPDVNVIFVFSAQEETGTSKIFPVFHKYNPNLVIELDVTFGTDYSNIEELEREAGKCELGKGLSLYRGTDICDDCWTLATKIAKKNKIPYQVQACNGDIGYTSLTTTGVNEGAKALVFGIPLRSMHTPTEVINLNDLKTGSKLLKAFLLSKQLKGKI